MELSINKLVMQLKEFLIFTESLISGMLPFVLLIFCGLYLSLKGKFFQFTRFVESIKLVKKAFCNGGKKKGSITSFQTACTSLSATVGTGNIAGVASAISIGGAGAIFWMWISALAGMTVKFAEVALAISYREKRQEEYVGGPMYYIKNGLPRFYKILGYIFAFAGIPAVICSGNITQTNAAVLSISENSSIRVVSGIIFTLLTAVIIGGGISRIGAVTEKIVPVMSVIYMILSVCIIIFNIDFLPKAFKIIIIGAFSPKAVTGGAVGSIQTAMIIGASRGVFSNEAGLGTSAMAHSVAVDAKRETQGLYGIFEVFIDTLLMCTLTALTILCSGVNIDYGTTASSQLVAKALSVCFGDIAHILLAVMMCIFAFSSVIGWAVYGDICTGFFFGKGGRAVFKVLYPLGCIIGAVCDVSFAWRLSSLFNGIMLCVNLPAILLLADEVLKYSKLKRK